MVSKDTLQQMAAISIKEESGTLPDISEVLIEGTTPQERLDSFLSQIGNPYSFRVGNTPVHITYENTEKSLEEVIKKFFLSLKQHDISIKM